MTQPVMDFDKIGADAAQVDDLTVDKKFERELPRAGIAMLRYVGYIETGKHIPKNPKHNAALKCIHIFELNHNDHKIELENGDKVCQRMYVHQNKGTTAASGYRKLFNVMNLAKDNRYNHFVQMLGQGFLGEIFHNTYEKKEYANLHLDGAWSLRKPVMVNVMDNTMTPVPIPEPEGLVQGFLWENEAISDENVVTMWNSLYIDGDRDDGSSKNWIQTLIYDNIEWEGSRTQSLTQDFVGLDGEGAGPDGSPLEPGEATAEDLLNMNVAEEESTDTGSDVPF